MILKHMILSAGKRYKNVVNKQVTEKDRQRQLSGC